MTVTRIRALNRGLQVLQYLSAVKSAHARDIAKAVGLPVSTVYRFVDTLVQGGFVRHTDDDSSYSLDTGVKRLSEGYDGEACVLEIGTRVLLRMRRTLIWPIELATFEGNAMMVRESTQRFNAQSTDRNLTDECRPLLWDPLGLAYLAACPRGEQRRILGQLAHSNDPAGHPAACRDGLPTGLPLQIGGLLARIDADGYAGSLLLAPQRWASIAMPVRHCGRVQAAVAIRWIKPASGQGPTLDDLAPTLRGIVCEIENGLNRLGGDKVGSVRCRLQ